MSLRMLEYLKDKLYRTRRKLSFLLAVVMAAAGIQFPTWADDGYDNYLDGWKINCAWSTLSN
ncbi:MAG: hypothetical protein Q4F76_12395, partial [Lachnospiraceae bacterium]|nr:hypothetical protein [Lachnospiraceae bacterium]